MHMATPRSTMSAKVGSCAGSRLCNRELGPLPNIRFGACGVRTGFVSPESPQTKTGPLWILAFATTAGTGLDPAVMLHFRFRHLAEPNVVTVVFHTAASSLSKLLPVRASASGASLSHNSSKVHTPYVWHTLQCRKSWVSQSFIIAG